MERLSKDELVKTFGVVSECIGRIVFLMIGPPE